MEHRRARRNRSVPAELTPTISVGMRARAARRVGPSLSNRTSRPSSSSISAPGWARNASLLQKGFRRRPASRRSGGGAWRSGKWRVRVLRRRSRQPLRDPSRARRRIAADGVPSVSQRRARGSAWHAHLAFTLLSDGCRAPARIVACDGVRDRGGAFFNHARWTCGGARRSRRAAAAAAPGMLMDHASYDAWERRAIGVLARDDFTAARALDIIRMPRGGAGLAAGSEQPARRGRSRVRHCVGAEAGRRSGGHAQGATNRLDVARVQLAVARCRRACRAVSLRGIRRLRRRLAGGRSPSCARILRRACSETGSRTIGHGLHAIVEYLRVCLSVLKLEAARQHATCESRHHHGRPSPKPSETPTCCSSI